jgi:hypothetical protein
MGEEKKERVLLTHLWGRWREAKPKRRRGQVYDRSRGVRASSRR